MSLKSLLTAFVRWFDSEFAVRDLAVETDEIQTKKVDWFRAVPFVAVHLACFSVIWVGWSWAAVAAAVSLYFLRMFAITGFYHRYFSHRTFSTSRAVQFLFALLGATAVQRGALWWAAHHRNHHRYSDTPRDVHSPRVYGFWWSHMGWILSKQNFPTKTRWIPDLMKYPELVFLNRFDILVPVATGFAVFYAGVFLEAVFPEWGTNGPQMLVWAFFISTVVLAHGTFTINSLSHVFGRQRYVTGDDSKNNFWLALITLGEGWHNNHHHFQGATRQGFFWWEIDITYYALKTLSWLGVVWDLHPVPVETLSAGIRVGGPVQGPPGAPSSRGPVAV